MVLVRVGYTSLVAPNCIRHAGGATLVDMENSQRDKSNCGTQWDSTRWNGMGILWSRSWMAFISTISWWLFHSSSTSLECVRVNMNKKRHFIQSWGDQAFVIMILMEMLCEREFSREKSNYYCHQQNCLENNHRFYYWYGENCMFISMESWCWLM